MLFRHNKKLKAQNVCVIHSVAFDSVTPWTVSPPLNMGFSRQEYWRGLPFPSPGNLPKFFPIEVDFFICLFNLFIYFNRSIITLQYCFCHTSTLISHRYTCVLPILNIPLPPDPIPLGCHRGLTLGALPHALNLHWSYLSHMVMYMFQCYSFKSSHPCHLPLSPKVCSSHLDWKLFSCHLL